MHRFRLRLLPLLLALPAVQAMAADDAIMSPTGNREGGLLRSPAAPPAYPATRRLDLVETHFGIPVADPYRWLENDIRRDDEVKQWVAAENAATGRYLEMLPGREQLRRRLTELFGSERYGTPRKAGTRYFYTYNSGLQNQSPLYVREGLHGEQRQLLDPNALSPDGTVALAEWRPSADGRLLVYAVQEGGSDWRTLHVLDVATGQRLEDRIRWVKFSDLAWNGKGTGFFYSRFDPPQQPGVAQPAVQGQQLWFHAIGTPQSADRLVYATPDRPSLQHNAQVTADGRWLLIRSSAGTDARRELTLIPLFKEQLRPARLVRGTDHEWQFAGNVGDQLYFRTTLGAPNGRVVLLDARHPHDPVVEIVPQREEALAGASLVGNRIVLAYVGSSGAVAELADLAGHPMGDVPLPAVGTAAGFGGTAGDPETFFSFSSFATPPTIYRYDVDTGEVVPFAQPRLTFDPHNFVTERVSYPSRDGTMIPMYIIRRRDVVQAGRPAPTLLYGYGGFNVSQSPGFSPTRLAWVEQGGVLAIASLRGGGEFGPRWHDAGRLSNKQNVFDDFIAAAEFLKARGYTGPDQLAIEGRSNGGLLVGAVVNQRPDLFAAALPAVGVMDMLRFDRFTAGRLWVDDYGHPDREPDFRTLLAYSPYHNIRPGASYPAILISTADMDDRVVPGHSFKYAAALQNADVGGKPRLLRVDSQAGHGAGKPTDKLIAEYTDMYSFIAYWTGLKVANP